MQVNRSSNSRYSSPYARYEAERAAEKAKLFQNSKTQSKDCVEASGTKSSAAGSWYDEKTYPPITQQEAKQSASKIMEDYYAGKKSAKQVETEVTNICNRMIGTTSYTIPEGKEKVKQALSTVYEIFSTANVKQAVEHNTDRKDPMYAVKCTNMQELFRSVSNQITHQCGSAKVDYESIEANTQLSMDGGITYDSITGWRSWQYGEDGKGKVNKDFQKSDDGLAKFQNGKEYADITTYSNQLSRLMEQWKTQYADLIKTSEIKDVDQLKNQIKELFPEYILVSGEPAQISAGCNLLYIDQTNLQKMVDDTEYRAKVYALMKREVSCSQGFKVNGQTYSVTGTVFSLSEKNTKEEGVPYKGMAAAMVDGKVSVYADGNAANAISTEMVRKQLKVKNADFTTNNPDIMKTLKERRAERARTLQEHLEARRQAQARLKGQKAWKRTKNKYESLWSLRSLGQSTQQTSLQSMLSSASQKYRNNFRYL